MDRAIKGEAGGATGGESEFSSAEPVSAPPAVAPDSDKPGTILSIQVLRFIASLIVVLFHSHVALAIRLAGQRDEAIDHAFRVGASGVHVFFVISGFVMVYTTWRSRLTPGKFFSRRLVRIYPIYWLMAGVYLIAHLLLGTAYRLSATQIAGAALLLPAASSLIIGPGWTLGYEMYFYICFALALFAGLKRGLLILSGFYLLSTAAGFLFGLHSSSFGNVMTNSLLLEFMAGAALGYAFAHGLQVHPRTGGALIILAVALFVSGFWLPYERLPSVISWGVPSLLLVTGSLSFEPWLRTRGGRAVAKLGDSSYLLYLSHVLLIDLLIATPISGWDRSPLAAVWLSIPFAAICTVAAALGYEVIELPLLNVLKSRLLRKRHQRATPPRAV